MAFARRYDAPETAREPTSLEADTSPGAAVPAGYFTCESTRPWGRCRRRVLAKRCGWSFAACGRLADRRRAAVITREVRGAAVNERRATRLSRKADRKARALEARRLRSPETREGIHAFHARRRILDVPPTCHTIRAWTPRHLGGRRGPGRRLRRGPRRTSGPGGRRSRRRLSGSARTVSERIEQGPDPSRRASTQGRRSSAYLATPPILGHPRHLRSAQGISGRLPGGVSRPAKEARPTHLLSNELNNEGHPHCKSSLFNNEGTWAHCWNNEQGSLCHKSQ